MPDDGTDKALRINDLPPIPMQPNVLIPQPTTLLSPEAASLGIGLSSLLQHAAAPKEPLPKRQASEPLLK